MNTITIAAAADNLNRYAVVYDKQIQSTLKIGLETESQMTQVRCLNTYSAPNAEVSSVIQAYQSAYTPSMTMDFDEVENKLCRMKVDILFDRDQVDAFWDSWMAEWVEDGKDPKEWSLFRYIYEEHVIPQIQEDLETKIAFNGVYVAPTPGTAGVTVAACDGLKKKVADAITATSLTPIPTGALVESTMVNQLETFCDALPLAYRNGPGTLLMSHTNARKYWRNYRDNFGTPKGNENTQNNELRIDATNKVVKGLASMEGSDAIIFTGRNNLILGRRIGEPYLPVIRWQVFERQLKGLAEFSRFYGFKHWGSTFVNDQFS